jgi:hypothetical protein
MDFNWKKMLASIVTIWIAVIVYDNYVKAPAAKYLPKI